MTSGIVATVVAVILAAAPTVGTNGAASPARAGAVAAPVLPPVLPNDNTVAAGTLVDGALTLNLRVAAGLWRPQGPSGPALQVEAFGESNGALSVPGPLVRVPAGTRIVTRIENDLATAVRVHGLCETGVAGCSPVEIEPGRTGELRFQADRAGTYQ